ncbi:MAG: cyclic nucleotide-binding domain-containing protein [Chloroflexi bacterium]|nr:MAG: cyclic nucleotide-binding domain-containing protein [Chloroflexota bacterium]
MLEEEEKKERSSMNKTLAALHPMRILGVFAHPDDESFCAGGTLARYVASGAEVMVVSATRGEAGQIRSAGVATRRTLGQVREQELYLACQRLGVQHTVCLDYGDGMLQEVDQDILIGGIVEIIRSFRPDVVITFGPDGGYGHPDHIAISAATTAACVRSGEGRHSPSQLAAGLAPHRPAQLFYSHFPHKRQLLLEQLAHWLVQTRTRFQGTSEFAYALLLLCEEATLLHYSCDHVDITWYPAGFSIVEQGEQANSLYLLLSGTAQVIREGVDGTHQVLAQLKPGAFFGEDGLAYRQTRNAHVIAEQSVTCLVLSPEAPTAFLGRGEDAPLPNLSGSAGVEEQDMEHVLKDTTCIKVDPYLRQKVEAIAAHRSQFPIQPDLLPLSILQALMGQEYFVPVSLVSEVEPEFLALQAAS